MRIKIEPFLMKKGNRVAKGAIEFESNDSILAGWHLVGFTICEDSDRGLFVLFPSSQTQARNADEKGRPFFFLKPSDPSQIDKLEDLILEEYERMVPDREAEAAKEIH